MKKGAVRKGKKQGPRRGARKMAIKRLPRNNVPERASCSETLSLGVQTSNTAYASYSNTLAQYPRASAIAKGYQFYRIKSITYHFKPLTDTFTATSGTSVPHLYYMIDRTKQLVSVSNANQLKQLGAIPHRLDDKIIRFTWRPSVLNGALDAAMGVASYFVQYKMSPWLPCRDMDYGSVWVANSTDHQGVVYIVENAGGAGVQYAVEKIVDFEFKKPAYEIVPPEEGYQAQEDLQPAVSNSGVVVQKQEA